MMKRRGAGSPCAYCNREMEDRASHTGLAATRDHHVPKSKGGRKTVSACRTCNSIKGDMMPGDWQAFMESFPRWWEHPRFKDIGERTPPVKYATTWHEPEAWDEKGNPYRYNAPRASTKRPTSIPIEYSDPRQQAAFEAIYKNKLHLLRVQIR